MEAERESLVKMPTHKNRRTIGPHGTLWSKSKDKTALPRQVVTWVNSLSEAEALAEELGIGRENWMYIRTLDRLKPLDGRHYEKKVFVQRDCEVTEKELINRRFEP